MSKLSERIATLCPNGVEYKRIGSFAEEMALKGRTILIQFADATGETPVAPVSGTLGSILRSY